MSIPQSAGGPIESRDDLVRYLAEGCKPREDWRIGTEHEKFVYCLKSLNPLRYEGVPGIKALLEGMRQFGWQPVMEGDNIIGLTQNGASISLEPGGQFELSGAPLKTVHETCAEVNTHKQQLRQVAAEIGAGVLGLGYAPTWPLSEVYPMPKGRYGIMKRYMPKVGGYGEEMMFRTCTVQVNLDFSSEADMIKKFRVSLALQPVATALFANSPFREGKHNGFLSYRAQVWTDVDNDRAGMLPWVFDTGMSFERYVDYVLDVPMYFVYRDGKYIDAAGLSFRDFLDGKLSVLPGEKPTEKDWEDHLSTAFPEVRLKSFLEMRGSDGGPWNRICALPALWVGLLYDQGALDAAWDLVKDWSMEERQILRDSVPKLGLDAPVSGGRTLRDIAPQVLDIARSGLAARQRFNAAGDNETGYLSALDEVIATGKTPAERLLDRYHGEWGSDVSRVYAEESF